MGLTANGVRVAAMILSYGRKLAHTAQSTCIRKNIISQSPRRLWKCLARRRILPAGYWKLPNVEYLERTPSVLEKCVSLITVGNMIKRLTYQDSKHRSLMR